MMASTWSSDEILEALYILDEEGTHSPASTEALARAKVAEDALRESLEATLIVEDGGHLTLTQEGRERGRQLVRRHRLAERLFHDVLQVADSVGETAACKFEHVLETEVTESICTLLGHPGACPHGRPIPPGPCCERRLLSTGAIVMRLSDMRTGDAGVVAYVHTAIGGRLDRLAAFGLLPGTRIKLHQKWPSVVVTLDQTELSFDRETAHDIFVRRTQE